ncbi:MAG TPA: hypothetical protein VHL09_11330 [Dehalococcoidia bacterium]|nr:hypothetical protein [Dehalococcoidia bacterium]
MSRSVDPRDLPFDDPVLLLHDRDRVEIVGRLPLARLLAESPMGTAAGLLPAAWSARPISLRIGARAVVDRTPRRRLRLDVERVTIGEQRLPPVVLRLLFEPARLAFVQLTLPDTVAELRIESGRAVIRPTSSRERI